MVTIATIILAAGESSRMGTPKQLLRVGDSSLLQRAAMTALAAELGPVIVVLGAQAELFAADLSPCDVTCVLNETWKGGMHTSIRVGVEAVEEICPICDAAIMMNCDQPHISAELLRRFAEVFEAEKRPAVASHYGNSLGTPALFSRVLFSELKALNVGGAKQILSELGDNVSACEFKDGEIDLDTPDDFARYERSRLMVPKPSVCE